MKTFSISMRPETMRRMRVLSAQYGVKQGDMQEALVTLAELTPITKMAKLVAMADSTEGCIVEEGTEAGHVAQARLGFVVEEF